MSKLFFMPQQTIDTYKLTSMVEPSDEILAQIMKEAVAEARESNRKELPVSLKK